MNSVTLNLEISFAIRLAKHKLISKTLFDATERIKKPLAWAKHQIVEFFSSYGIFLVSYKISISLVGDHTRLFKGKNFSRCEYLLLVQKRTFQA